MIFLTIILFIIVCVLAFVAYNMYSKVSTLESEINRVVDTTYTTYDIMIKLIHHAKMEMDRIDHRGAFKSDDEVGFTFKALQACIDTLAEEMDKLNNTDEQQ